MSVATVPEEMTLQIDMELAIKAPASKVFAALIRQLTSEFGPGDHKMSLTLETWPGGRWYRDLGDKQGHFWGHVQVIKKDKLLEICGPLFMSYAAANHLQFRLNAEGDRTTLVFKHRGIGMIDDEHRKGVTDGWKQTLEAVRSVAEGR